MGSINFSEFTTYLKQRFGMADNWDAVYGVWINTAYRMVANRDTVGKKKVYFPELNVSTALSTSDGVAYVSVPTDCASVTEVFDDTSNVRLDWIPFSEYLSKTDRDTAAAEAAPTYWNRSGGYIYLYPTPDATYSLTTYYRKRPATLTGTDVTAIGQEWDDIILELAVFVGRNWANEPDKAEYARKLAEDMITQTVGIYDTEERARREKLRPESFMTDRKTY